MISYLLFLPIPGGKDLGLAEGVPDLACHRQGEL